MKKTILITGASGNLGKASVEKFLVEGYTVLATVSSGKTLGYSVNGSIETYEADLSNEKSSETAVRAMIEKHKTIDAVLLLAGGFAAGSINETDGAAIKKMFSINFDTAYNVVRPIFQQMMTQTTGGRIVFIGARPALQPKDGKHTLAYALSKSLIFKLAEFLNAEGAAKNVVSSVVVPSTIDTPLNRTGMPNADFSTWVKPEEIAAVMAFIAGGEAPSLRDGVVEIYGRA